MSEVDVLLITALKEEYEAARDAALAGNGEFKVSEWEERDAATSTPYLRGKYSADDGREMVVALARATRMGTASTLPILASLVERLAPQCLAMCGVCAGNPDEVALGDVIIAETVYFYDEGKRKRNAVEGDHRQFPMAENWIRRAQEMTPEDLPSFGRASEAEAKNWVLERLYAGDAPRSHPARPRYFPRGRWQEIVTSLVSEGMLRLRTSNLELTRVGRSFVEKALFFDVDGPLQLPFQIRVGPIASGNVVVKDGITWDRLRKWGVRSVLGLDMEAAAVGNAAHRLNVPAWAVVKGVMDHADPRKDDRYKPFAARASAEVLLKYLSTRSFVAPSEALRRASTARTHAAAPLRFTPSATNAPELFAASIIKRMAELKRKVEFLTDDQRQTLHQLRYRNRVVITGCAGSGKTLLVAEKAIRLDRAGVRTLVLCHSPNLSRHLMSLIANTAIDTYDVATFVNHLAGINMPERRGWTAFEEPLETDLALAFDAIDETTAVYDAIIVDEGQDFRESWWTLLEALLQYSRTKTLYIFADDNQALLRYRSRYPILDPPVSLSKNCRNGGNVFEIVGRCHRGAPLVSNFLTGDGVAKITSFDELNFTSRLEEALLDAYKHAAHAQIRVLTNEPYAHLSRINNFKVVKQAERRWRAVVESDLQILRDKAATTLQNLRSSSSESEIANRFGLPSGKTLMDYFTVPSLSGDTIPSKDDVRAVTEFASRLVPFFGGVRKADVRFVVRAHTLQLSAKTHTGKETRVNNATRVRFYSEVSWASSIERGRPTFVSADHADTPDPDHLPLYSLDAFKGLESDAVVLFINSANSNVLREIYVGASRAVFYLNLVISRPVLASISSLGDLPSRSTED